jgi:signal transduction histidine kinase
MAIERQKLEAQIRKTQKIESIGNLAGGIAHDFKNLLFIINGYMDLAMMEPSCTDEVRDIIRKALHASNRAKDLTSQILTFSREKGSIDKVIQVAPLINDAIVLVKSALPKTITINQCIETNTEFVKIDPTKLYQIVINLCANASEAMVEKEGRLQITLAKEAIGEFSHTKQKKLIPGNYVRLTVSDNGTGISPGSIKQIFDPFFTTKDESGGTGLGLALVNQIVRNHGGMITVNSELGKGSEFNVYLPTTHPEIDHPIRSTRLLN